MTARAWTAAVLALGLISAACDDRGPGAIHGSVTVKLPPPRPAATSPGFSFAESRRPATG
jgi:hypothetical protein